MEPLIAVGGLLLLAAWITASVRHHRRRAGAAAAEWESATAKPDLWSSVARCAACGARGGLLELEGDTVTFVCLACGGRAPRDTRA